MSDIEVAEKTEETLHGAHENRRVFLPGLAYGGTCDSIVVALGYF